MLRVPNPQDLKHSHTCVYITETKVPEIIIKYKLIKVSIPHGAGDRVRVVLTNAGPEALKVCNP